MYIDCLLSVILTLEKWWMLERHLQALSYLRHMYLSMSIQVFLKENVVSNYYNYMYLWYCCCWFFDTGTTPIATPIFPCLDTGCIMSWRRRVWSIVTALSLLLFTLCWLPLLKTKAILPRKSTNVHLCSLVTYFSTNIIYNFVHVSTGLISVFQVPIYYLQASKLVNLLIPLRSSYDVPFVS